MISLNNNLDHLIPQCGKTCLPYAPCGIILLRNLNVGYTSLVQLLMTNQTSLHHNIAWLASPKLNVGRLTSNIDDMGSIASCMANVRPLNPYKININPLTSSMPNVGSPAPCMINIGKKTSDMANLGPLAPPWPNVSCPRSLVSCTLLTKIEGAWFGYVLSPLDPSKLNILP